ncbi:hypothetical protein [Methylobacterium sp. P1-11]|uniref:phage neck terminator protein n=1 Tax=Methylobacterium sp. P1-11 TaxID=2024616 RepID=UPI0011ECF60D|nr:hypothetical protein [Methylobacterium sp. P1-11]
MASPNTSATGGYLGPVSAEPLDDLALDSAIAGVIAGITGLAAALVIPRDQPSQPRIPDVTTNWVSVGVTVSTGDDTPSQIHHPDGDGYTILRAFYRLDVMAMFYGPKSDGYAKLLRDGLFIGQNREAMRAQSLNFVSVDPLRRVPEIVATQTRRRTDLAFRLTQTVERKYQILNVLQADGTIRADASGKIELTPFLSPLPPA